ncbi:MAG: FadR family transcriptional regulator [Gammaproteobacteria bacterium]|nr:FadR family transcriptional regulator [Gammaproteobacteria bacterium]
MPTRKTRTTSALAAGPRRRTEEPGSHGKLSHVIAEQLRGRIARGQLVAGDSLPSEAQLLAEFSVSRPTLREALRVLESERLIQLSRGARFGATVIGPSIEAVSRYSGLYLASRGTTLAEIHQVRMLIEPPLAAYMAQYRSEPHVRALQECVQSQQAALQNKDYFATITAVIDFHDIMERSVGNGALGLIAGMLHDCAINVYPQMLMTGSNEQSRAVKQRTEESVKAHAALLELIAQGKMFEAESFWRSYMQDTAAFLTRTGLAGLRTQAPLDLKLPARKSSSTGSVDRRRKAQVR